MLSHWLRPYPEWSLQSVCDIIIMKDSKCAMSFSMQYVHHIVFDILCFLQFVAMVTSDVGGVWDLSHRSNGSHATTCWKLHGHDDPSIARLSGWASVFKLHSAGKWKTANTLTGLIWFIYHDDVITWPHFLNYWPFVLGILEGYWPFVLGIHWLPADSQHKGAVMWSFDVILTSFEQTVELPVTWDASTSMWRHCND